MRQRSHFTSGIMGLFKVESKEDAWKRLNQELKQHLGSIYYKIETASENEDNCNSLREAYFSNTGLDSLDTFRDEITRLNAIHRSTMSCCERTCEICGEIAICFCYGLTTLLSIYAKQPLPILTYEYPNYEDPRHSKSPYSELATAVSDYAKWYSYIPKHFTNGSIESMNIKKACADFKKEHLSIEIIISPKRSN